MLTLTLVIVFGSGLMMGLTQQKANQQSSQPADQPTDQDVPLIVEKDLDSIAQECVVTFLNGRRITGILMESDEESIVLRINNIDTTYRRARLASVRFLPPVEERYRTFRSALPDNDIEGRLVLVDWLRDRRAYELAVVELTSILEDDPGNAEAELLKTWLEQHLKLAQKKVQDTDTPTTRVRSRLKTADIPMLSEEQINLIRVYEIDLTNPPKLKVEQSTIQKLMKASPDDFPADQSVRAQILKGSELEKLKLLFRNKARDLYSEVKVLEDPESMVSFRKSVAGQNGWLTNGCATARCHGGPDAGEFKLIGTKPNSAETVYTNFLILERFELRDGTPLVNYQDPERSPLLQMGLPRVKSLTPHPDVDATKFGRDWRPVFRSSSSTNFQRTLDWIRSMYTPRPDYGIEYPPPAAQTPPSQGDTQNSNPSKQADSQLERP